MLLYLKEYFVDCNNNCIFPNLAAYYNQSCSSLLSLSLIWLSWDFLYLKLHSKCKMMTFVWQPEWTEYNGKELQRAAEKDIAAAAEKQALIVSDNG